MVCIGVAIAGPFGVDGHVNLGQEGDAEERQQEVVVRRAMLQRKYREERGRGMNAVRWGGEHVEAGLSGIPRQCRGAVAKS